MSSLDSLYLRIADDSLKERLRSTMADYQAMVGRWQALIQTLVANPRAQPVIVGSMLHRARCVGTHLKYLNEGSAKVFSQVNGSFSRLTLDVPEYECADFIEGLPFSAKVTFVDSSGHSHTQTRFFTLFDEGEDIYCHIDLPASSYPIEAEIRGVIDPDLVQPVPAPAFRTMLRLHSQRKKKS